MADSFLDTPIEYLKGVGPKRAELLKKELGIFSFYDLIHFFPFRYVDRSRFYTIREIENDVNYIQLKGTIRNVQYIGAGRGKRLVATLSDHTGTIEMVWFQGFRWIEGKIKTGVEYTIFGKPSWFNGRFNLAHPELEPLIEAQASSSNPFMPFYSSTEKLKSAGLDSKGISKLMKNLVSSDRIDIPENLPFWILDRYKLMPRLSALTQIHFPDNPEIQQKAEARLKFEELFFIQLRLCKLKATREQKVKGFVFPVVGHFFNEFFKLYLPFQLTDAQKKVIREIRVDLGSGKQMNRLLQGDVGSGKTLVALMVALIAIDNGFQACLMSPTEILANQHYQTLQKMTQGLGVSIHLLTGSTKAAVRKIIDEGLTNGNFHLLIGTHALIEENVVFKNLGLVIIDEQHRFGVEQRAKLWKKSNHPPHILVMTATPIPRTLAMTLYGDLDISVIDKLPPGRKPVVTRHVYESSRLRIIGFMKKQIEGGRQIFIVYPLIKESEKLDLANLMEGYDAIIRSFPLPHYAVSIVHGKMKSADKEFEMQRFIKGQTQIMVATTVIEVGVDIPNASVMIIENAERYGLSQLHQLRGRVGRGADQSYCVLVTGDKLSADSLTRIQTMVGSNNGFEIAEVDLRLRGPGDLAGTRQSGIMDLKIANLVRDEAIIATTRNIAMELLHADPRLEKDIHQPVVRQLLFLSKKYGDWSSIS
ncbi:MAG: ATP-dependent DNA helicase RecG [Bacteroidetes bacterium]|nr:ATP-dependent DNA helicase RecG [Bacteroidota bacterium]